MKFGKTKKVLVGACLFTALALPVFSTNLIHKDIKSCAIEYSYVSRINSFNGYNTLRGEKKEVTIHNEKLKSAIYTLLGKEETDKLYSDDFLVHDNYKTREETDPDTDITRLVSNKNCLDLSGTGVTDITDLVQFEFPETLQAIDLSDNNMTNTDISKLANFLNLNTESNPIVIGENTLEIRSNFDNIIKKVNLLFNKLNLSTLDVNHLTNSKIIYGIQNLNEIDSSGIITSDEIEAEYYINSNDCHYFSFSFLNPLGENTHKHDAVYDLVDDSEFGEFSISIQSIPNSETNYFNGFSKSYNFRQISIAIDDNFSVERKSLFELPIDQVKIKGVDTTDPYFNITYRNASTNEVGTSSVLVTLDLGYTKRTFALDFNVVDTTKPVLSLKGQSVMYLSKNREFVDPGCTGTDSGDDISTRIEKSGTVDFTKIGTYYITYNLVDLAGNSADPITRKVIVEEAVLDKINVRYTDEQLFTNKEIHLVVEPDANVPSSNYHKYSYEWYINDVFFISTTGDNVTGKSITTITPDKTGTYEIKVVMTAYQKADGTRIVVESETLFLDVELQMSDDTALIIASAVAVLLILAIVITIYIIKHKKAKKKISKKSNPSTPKQDIQVIKNYDGTNGNDDINNLFK